MTTMLVVYTKRSVVRIDLRKFFHTDKWVLQELICITCYHEGRAILAKANSSVPSSAAATLLVLVYNSTGS